MQQAMYHVSEPIFFSGSTIFLAMLTLFVTIFKPYNYFAPVFSTAVIFILLAGLTLIPSIFALLGRPAFWPFIPKVEEKQKDKKTFWTKINTFDTKHPAAIENTIIINYVTAILHKTTITLSYNYIITI